jgi:hypothetical protein
VDGWMDGWMDGWIHTNTHIYKQFHIYLTSIQAFFLENALLLNKNITFVQMPSAADFLNGYAVFCGAFTFYDEVCLVDLLPLGLMFPYLVDK